MTPFMVVPITPVALRSPFTTCCWVRSLPRNRKSFGMPETIVETVLSRDGGRYHQCLQFIVIHVDAVMLLPGYEAQLCTWSYCNCPLLLFVDRKLLQIVHVDLSQRLLIRRVQEDLGHDLVSCRLPPARLERLQPSGRTQAPFAPSLHPGDRSEIIALSSTELEELVAHFGCHGVVAEVGGWDLAVAVAHVAGHRVRAVDCQGLFED